MQTVLLFAFAGLPVWIWSALHSGATVAAMILAACSGLVASVDSRLYVFYVVGGLLGVTESLALVLLNVFVSSLFPEGTFDSPCPFVYFLTLVRSVVCFWPRSGTRSVLDR